ncbi:thiamine pyrophosphate-dependent enzyme [Spirillospora sp. CA-255316]
MRIVPTEQAPKVPARLLEDFAPSLVRNEAHHLCPGCGEPIVMRAIAETISELALASRSIGVVGIGCYTGFSSAADIDIVQALHGRAPSLATGVKRVRPDSFVFTLQGDGDMVNEGLQEILHTAARAERVTAILVNNGVFGETGGHMTSTSVLGQRTKNTLEGRDAARHGFPIPIADLLAQLEGVVYVARGAVNTAANVTRTRRAIRRAFELQEAGAGFTFVEVLTMCPTGWFLETRQAPDYLDEKLAATYRLGVLKDLSASSDR